MASEYYECKAELSTTTIHDILEEEVVKEEAPENTSFGKYGNEPDTSLHQFGDIHIMKLEIVEEDLIETKPFRDYVVFNKCLEKKEKKRFHDSSEFQVTQSNSVNRKESKLPPTDFWENKDFNVFSGELAKPTVNHLDNEIIWKNEDEGHSKCTKDSPVNSTEIKTETFKTEYDIDIIYEDVKPHLTEEKSSGKIGNESNLNLITDVLIGTKIEANLSREFSKDSGTWPQQNMEEDGTAVERGNDTRKKPTVTTNSKNFQMIRKLVHCKFNSIPDTDKNPFQCKICSKTFKTKGHLTRHEIIHTGVKPFQCKVCSKSFYVKVDLTRHERSHTGEKPFQCEICPKSFAQKQGLLDHERIHTGEKPFQCKICPKSFTQKRGLLYHERIHTGGKPFQCKICSKSFNLKKQLKIHEPIHTGVFKPFQCKICPKRYADESTSLQHEKIHTMEKPFKCLICPKSFNRMGQLKIHERTHTGEKPFQCQTCQMRFSFKCAMLRHHEKLHEEKTVLTNPLEPGTTLNNITSIPF